MMMQAKCSRKVWKGMHCCLPLLFFLLFSPFVCEDVKETTNKRRWTWEDKKTLDKDDDGKKSRNAQFKIPWKRGVTVGIGVSSKKRGMLSYRQSLLLDFLSEKPSPLWLFVVNRKLASTRMLISVTFMICLISHEDTADTILFPS